MRIVIIVVGLVAVNALGFAVGWHVTDWQWWVTVAPLSLLIGAAGAAWSNY